MRLTAEELRERAELYLTTETPALRKYVRAAEAAGDYLNKRVYELAIELRQQPRRYLKVQLFVGEKAGNWYVSDLAHGCLQTIVDDLSNLDPGDSFRITAVMMTPEEVDALGAFVGF